jgi:TfoX/Sxy family transcriptional regulator of competence genes
VPKQEPVTPESFAAKASVNDLKISIFDLQENMNNHQNQINEWQRVANIFYAELKKRT